MLKSLPPTVKKTVFITTPIYYVNASPHIGHLYSSLIADAAQRWQKVLNPHLSVRFATGTDEHGTKIQQAAAKNNIPLIEYCSNVSEKYKNLSDVFSIAYTDFIRTTDENHKTAVGAFWNAIKANGHIYSAKYGGWYCVPDETFLTQSQLKESVGPNGEKTLIASESGHPVEWVEEQNYMFRLSNFQDRLIHWLTKNENAVKPKHFYKILLDWISAESLPDVSISRPTSRVHWGITVPGDVTQTVYVWMDALVNYLTVAGYPRTSDDKFRCTWPPDVQVIGKDILKHYTNRKQTIEPVNSRYYYECGLFEHTDRKQATGALRWSNLCLRLCEFHGIYWPAFLMAADLDPPRTLLCHSHWTVDAEKMSKSKNNVVCPIDRKELYTTDGLRYFLLREGVAHSDGNYSDTKVIRILNSELADTLGNLLSRCTGTALNPDQVFPEMEPTAFQDVASEDVTKKLIEAVSRLPDLCEEHYNNYDFYKAADAVILTLHKANAFFEHMKPWLLRKDPACRDKLNVVLHMALETLRICGILLQPLIPNISEKLLDIIMIPRNERTFENTKIISWNYRGITAAVALSSEKTILFKRILLEQEKRGKAQKS